VRVTVAGTRNYQSIGEVLVGVKTEFPDITISKIRFLESEGLITPERTPSGYRKFYVDDVDRLKSILRMQRDEYLPLKVIKERLAKLDAGDDGVEPSLDGSEGVEAGDEAIGQTAGIAVDELAEAPTGLQMSIEEMSAASGVDKERIKELEAFGIVCSHGPDGARYYDGDDYIVLSIVRDFFRFGIEPRHLTMYKHFADRESAFFEALVAPTLRQKNPEARRTAAQTLADLAVTSKKFKQALLRTSLRDHLKTA
jgi:DNA-binding transcriptional MerR regulator